MNEKDYYCPLPRELAKFLTENGYEETENGRFDLKGEAQAMFPDCTVSFVGREDVILVIVRHTPKATREIRGLEGGLEERILAPKARGVCHTISRDTFASPRWKWVLDGTLRHIALAIFLPFFNLYEADPNDHIIMK